MKNCRRCKDVDACMKAVLAGKPCIGRYCGDRHLLDLAQEPEPAEDIYVKELRQAGPMTTRELAMRVGVEQHSVMNAMRRLRDEGKVETEGRRYTPETKKWAPTWRAA